MEGLPCFPVGKVISPVVLEVIAGKRPYGTIRKPELEDVSGPDLPVQRRGFAEGIGVFDGQYVFILKIAKMLREALDGLEALGIRG